MLQEKERIRERMSEAKEELVEAGAADLSDGGQYNTISTADLSSLGTSAHGNAEAVILDYLQPHNNHHFNPFAR